jgi:hypothetical protein
MTPRGIGALPSPRRRGLGDRSDDTSADAERLDADINTRGEKWVVNSWVLTKMKSAIS